MSRQAPPNTLSAWSQTLRGILAVHACCMVPTNWAWEAFSAKAICGWATANGVPLSAFGACCMAYCTVAWGKAQPQARHVKVCRLRTSHFRLVPCERQALAARPRVLGVWLSRGLVCGFVFRQVASSVLAYSSTALRCVSCLLAHVMARAQQRSRAYHVYSALNA